jgi:hypothetical protein
MGSTFSKIKIVRTVTEDGQRLVGLAIDGVDEQELVSALEGEGEGEGEGAA